MWNDEPLKEQIGQVLDKHHEGSEAPNTTPWCGCYEGDIEDLYPQAREEALAEILSLIKPYLASKKV